MKLGSRITAAQLGRIVIGVVTLAGSIAFVGWFVDADPLKRLFIGSAPVRPNECVVLLLLGLGLLGSHHPESPQAGSPRKLAVMGCLTIVLLITGISFVEGISQLQLGSGRIFFHVIDDPDGLERAAIAPNSALTFFLITAAAALLNGRRINALTQCFAVAGMMISLLAVLGHLYEIRSFHEVTLYSSMTVPVAILGLLAGLGVLLSRPDHGLVSLLTGPAPGGVLLVRLFLVIVVAQAFLGWLGLVGHKEGFYRYESGVALFASANILLFLLLVWSSGKSLSHAEKALIASEERFRQLADAMPQMVWTATPHGTIDYYNRRWMEYTQSDLIEHPDGWWSAIHPDDGPACQEQFEAAMATQTTLQMECRLKRSDGEFRWHLVRAVPVWDSVRDSPRWFGTCTDIDGQKRAYQEIDRLNQTLLAVLEALAEPVFVMTPDSGAQMRNPAADDFLAGLDSSHGLPQALQDRASEVMQTGRHYLPTGFEGVEHFVLHNEERYFLPRVVAMKTHDQDIFGCVILLYDVTQFRLLDKVKTNLLGTVSHELKTPITSIRMSVYLLREQESEKVSEESGELLRIACEESDHLLSTLNSLLDLTRFDEGRLKIRRAPVSPSDLAQSALREIEQKATSRQISLKTEIQDDLPAIEVDQDRIVHALTNLLSNACKFSPTEGKVVLRIRQSENGGIYFGVQDNGPGIAQEHRERLFERFYRVPGSQKSGSGLGLSIVQEFVKAHEGSTGVVSTPGEGSEFYFTVPLQPASAETQQTMNQSGPA